MWSVPTLLLILHSLVGVALLGAITHQLVSLYRRRAEAQTQCKSGNAESGL
jgi:hypothetical protein